MELTSLSGVRLGERLGEGGGATVVAGEWDGRPVAVKLYKPAALARHERRHRVPLPRYEFERNAAFFAVPGLRPHVAEPLGFVHSGGTSALVQERLDGTLYYFHVVERGGAPDPVVVAQLERVVALAHEAGLHDVDLHAMNVMIVAGEGGEPLAKLFDFGLIPFAERPRNPLIWLLLKAGLMDARARDLRKLRDLHDFARIERKLVRFYR